LQDLFDFIAIKASPRVANKYVSELIDYCESLSTFPYRGNTRNDIRNGLRTTNFKGRVVIAFTVIDDETVAILGVYYGGRNFELDLADSA
jgi:toxin ParE1/3/4